ncbi:hypothetical protein [Desulfuromonas sp. TF]|uniref:transposase n=1 Tax=Desulfuromonas sp. TF TaxID=1232410 RepID=UPI000483DE9D|nr:hypothetical protein [Desulfuromonas sp. TF]
MESLETTAISDRARPTGISFPAEVAKAFGADFLDPERCGEIVLAWIHPGPAVCPRCGLVLEGRSLARFQSFGRVHCRECGKFFTATAGTALHKVQISPSQIVLIAYLLALEVDLVEISRAASVDPETVRLWRLKFAALARGGRGK